MLCCSRYYSVGDIKSRRKISHTAGTGRTAAGSRRAPKNLSTKTEFAQARGAGKGKERSTTGRATTTGEHHTEQVVISSFLPVQEGVRLASAGNVQQLRNSAATHTHTLIPFRWRAPAGPQAQSSRAAPRILLFDGQIITLRYVWRRQVRTPRSLSKCSQGTDRCTPAPLASTREGAACKSRERE